MTIAPTIAPEQRPVGTPDGGSPNGGAPNGGAPDAGAGDHGGATDRQNGSSAPGRSDGAGRRPAPSRDRHARPGSSPPGRIPGVLLYFTTFAAYLVIGFVLTLHYHLVDADGPSRVANAGYVLFSRDPHLAAIGFVWNPLPSLVEIPILLFTPLWGDLLSQGQAGTFMSAAFMAGAVWQVRGIAIDRGLPASWRWVVVAGFAFNPMIILYGGNAMSEAPFMFFTLWAARRLLRWMRGDKVNDLVVAGLAFGFDYLTRYEAAAATGAAVVMVVAVSTLRGSAPDWGERGKRAIVDGAVVVFPFLISFAGWTMASWITTGIAFPQFSSQYGNSSQVGNASAGVKAFQKLAGGPLAIVGRDIFHLEPFLPLAIIVVLILAVRRVDLDFLVPMTLFGGILAFEAYAQLKAETFAWFRFFLMSVPLMIVLVMLIWPYRGTRSTRTASEVAGTATLSEELRAVLGHPKVTRLRPLVVRLRPMVDRLQPARAWVHRHLVRLRRIAERIRTAFPHVTLSSRRGVVLGGILLIVMLVPSIPLTWSGMLNPLVGTQTEQSGLHTLTNPTKYPIKPSTYRNDQYLADYLNRLNLPEASVLMDTFIGWDVWLNSDNRKKFVITSDFDFIQVLNAPQQYGIQYILVSDPDEDGQADAVNQRYPTLYRTGAGFASLVMTVPQTGDDATWRLYRVDGVPQVSASSPPSG